MTACSSTHAFHSPSRDAMFDPSGFLKFWDCLLESWIKYLDEPFEKSSDEHEQNKAFVDFYRTIHFIAFRGGVFEIAMDSCSSVSKAQYDQDAPDSVVLRGRLCAMAMVHPLFPVLATNDADLAKSVFKAVLDYYGPQFHSAAPKNIITPELSRLTRIQEVAQQHRHILNPRFSSSSPH